MTRSRSRRGNSLLEFTLTCLPLIFLLISLAEMSRYMWSYHTLAFAVERGARFTVVHGQGCSASSPSCPVSVATVAQVIRQAAAGLDPGQLNVVLTSGGSSRSCVPLNSCLANADVWPPAAENGIGLPVRISGTYPFRSALGMFWPGAGSVKTGAVTMGAAARESVRF